MQFTEESITIAAGRLGFSWQLFRAVVVNDYDEIFARLAAEHFDAAYLQGTPVTAQPENITRISQLALRHQIPTVSETALYAERGLLLTYGQNYDQGVARAGRAGDET